MKKLLLTATLLTSFASAQWSERVVTDDVTDEKTYASLIQGKGKKSGSSEISSLALMCAKKGETMIISSRFLDPNKTELPVSDSVKFRLVGHDDFTAGKLSIDEGLLLFARKDDIDKLSGSELRVSYRDYFGGLNYHEFKIPNVEDSDAYKKCFE